MGVSSRMLEITVMSGENVNMKDEEAYVVVRAESIKCCTTKMVKNTTSSTIGLCHKGSNGDNNNDCSSLLSWNEKLSLETPLHARSITFEVHSKKSKGNGRPIGVARIAISEILGGCNGNQVKNNDDGDDSNLQVFSYWLRDWDGRRNGIIHFKVKAAAAAVAAAVPEEPISVAKPVAARELPKKNSRHKKKCRDVVLGFPLWWNYPNII